MTPKTYVAEPVTAMQWDGTDASALEICRWVLGREPSEEDWESDALAAYNLENRELSVLIGKPVAWDALVEPYGYVAKTKDGLAIFKQESFETAYRETP